MPVASVSFQNRGTARYGQTSRSGITTPRRANPQFVFGRSYGPSINGLLSFWDEELLEGRYREFWLDSFLINDQTVISTDTLLFSATLTGPGSLTYRDDGFGLSIANYVDAFNTILQNNNLSTRFYPADGYSGIFGLAASVNVDENFQFNLYDISTSTPTGGAPGTTPLGYSTLRAIKGRIFEAISSISGLDQGSLFIPGPAYAAFASPAHRVNSVAGELGDIVGYEPTNGWPWA